VTDIVAVEFEVTACVLIPNLVNVVLAATPAVAGTIAFVLLDLRLTTPFVAGVAPLKNAVPVTPVPPYTDSGDTVTLESPTGETSSVFTN
jgi:hypothetical protein